MKILCIGLSIVLTSLMVIAGNWYAGSSANSTPSETVEQYYKLALDGKIEEALAFWTDHNPTLSGFRPGAAAVSGESTHESWTRGIYESKEEFAIKEEKIHDNQASVLVHTKFSNGYTFRTIYKLIKVEEKWKLHELSSPSKEEADRIAEEAYRRDNPEEEKQK